MNTLLIIALVVFVICFVFLLGYALMGRKKLGRITGEVTYSDHGDIPGDVLYAKKYHLMGKPDFILRDGNSLIPIEVKTGKTPNEPYQNHEMQLMAYCVLIEEHFGVTPKGGYIRYPEKEFHVLYTPDAKKSVLLTINKIIAARSSSEEPQCKHSYHYF